MGLHELISEGVNATHWYHICLVPFWVTIVKENEYGEEDVDGELEYL